MTGAMTEFLAMGGYAGYVWPAYGAAVLVLAGLLIWTVRGLRHHRQRLARMERRRRGNAGTPARVPDMTPPALAPDMTPAAPAPDVVAPAVPAQDMPPADRSHDVPPADRSHDVPPADRSHDVPPADRRGGTP